MKKATAIFISAILMIFTACATPSPTRITGFAMDTDISITVYGDSAAANGILLSVTELENKLSWNVDGSAVATLNQSGEVTDKALADIVLTAMALYDDTDGRYSLAVRELCALWNINSGESKIPTQAEIDSVLSRTGKMPTVDGSKICLSDGQGIDLGSVGKGAACDKAAELLLSAGKSGIAAIGSSLALCGTKPSGEKWSVTVASPDDRNSSMGTLYLDGGCFVSTSNGTQRGFTVDGRRYHHIFDAKSGYPSRSDIKSVTVIASSGILSDALSTACYIVGYEKARQLVEKHNARALFILDSGEIELLGELSFEVAK